MLARALKSSRASKYDILRELPECDHLTECWPPLRERSGLVEHERVNVAQCLDRFGTAKENTQLCAATACDHDGNWRCKPERTRTRNDEHGNRVHQRVSQTRLRADDPPYDEGNDRDADDCRDEPGRDPVGKLLQGCARALRLTDERHDLREETVGPHMLCLDDERSSLIDRCTHHTIADALLNGQRLAREHRLIDTRLTAHDPAIDRNPFPRSNSNPIPDRQGFK